MAQMSKPDWQPRPVKSMPALTIVTFNVKPGGSAAKTRVHYQLISPRVVLGRPAGSAQIPPDELSASTPKPTPVARADRIIDDDYVLPASVVAKITRALRLELASSQLLPGTATLVVTVFDVTAQGELVGKTIDSQQITFEL